MTVDVVQFLPLVKRVAERLHGGSSLLDRDDLVGQASLYLLEVVQSYDVDRGMSLKSWIHKKVRFRLLDYMRQMSFLSRSAIKKIQNGEQERIYQVSFDTSITYNKKGEAVKLYEILEEHRSTGSLENRDTVRRLFRSLKALDRLIMRLYYFENFSMREIADSIDLSESRVSQIHAQILEQIRDGFVVVDGIPVCSARLHSSRPFATNVEAAPPEPVKPRGYMTKTEKGRAARKVFAELGSEATMEEVNKRLALQYPYQITEAIYDLWRQRLFGISTKIDLCGLVAKISDGELDKLLGAAANRLGGYEALRGHLTKMEGKS